MVTYDRATAARFNIAPQLIDDTLYDAFGQRQVSTMYTSLNQYHVVMEAAPEFWQNPQFLQSGLRELARRPAGSAERAGRIRTGDGSADGQSPGAFPGRDDFVQSCAQRFARRRGERDQCGGR